MRKLLLVFILIFLTTSMDAQYKPMIFGLRIGGNLGWMKADAEGYTSDGAEPGFTWGFVAQFFLMENYAIQTGFNMSFNGGRLQYPAFAPVDGDTLLHQVMLSRNYNLKYIQIPLTLKMQTSVSERWRLFGKIGLGTAFLLDSGAKDSYSYNDQNYNSSTDINDEITLMRESLIVGGGFEFILKGSTALVIDLTYDNGFNNILSAENPATPGIEPRAFHNYVELGAGIVF